MGALVLVEAAVAGHIGSDLPPALRAVPAPAPRRWWRRGDSRCTAIAAATDLLLDDPTRERVVLAGPCSDSELVATARALGFPIVALACDGAEAAWVAALAAQLAEVGGEPFLRALEVLAVGPGVACDVPRRPWGPDGVAVPALRPVTLARWATRAWTPCSWCARGGAPGHHCARCGAHVGAAPKAPR